eukprot:scaffold14233_cov148-Isochrysis_galbana.AAC.2
MSESGGEAGRTCGGGRRTVGYGTRWYVVGKRQLVGLSLGLIQFGRTAGCAESPLPKTARRPPRMLAHSRPGLTRAGSCSLSASRALCTCCTICCAWGQPSSCCMYGRRLRARFASRCACARCEPPAASASMPPPPSRYQYSGSGTTSSR